jgi:hypothetical protein
MMRTLFATTLLTALFPLAQAQAPAPAPVVPQTPGFTSRPVLVSPITGVQA